MFGIENRFQLSTMNYLPGTASLIEEIDSEFSNFCCEKRPGLGVKCHYYSLLTGLSSIFKDSSLQVRSPHREYNTGLSTTVYLTILQDRLHTVSSSLYICVCTPQDPVFFSSISGSSRTLHIFSHVLLVIIHKPGKQVSTLKAYAIMRLSSFAYRITTQEWENLSALHSSHFYYLNFAVYV